MKKKKEKKEKKKKKKKKEERNPILPQSSLQLPRIHYQLNDWGANFTTAINTSSILVHKAYANFIKVKKKKIEK